MAIVAGLLNGTNLNRDFHFQALISELFSEGVRKGYSTGLEVQANLVKAGMCFVEVTRTSVTPNETFLVPVVVGADVVVNTTGTGYAIVKIPQTKVNDGSSNAVDGTGIATVEVVGSLPTDPYIQLARITGGVITDTRTFSKVKDNTNGVLDNIQSMIDMTIGSGNWKASVRCATTTAGTLASSFENGDTVDTVTLTTGDRILIKDQADAKQNGIYTVNASGSPTRAADFDGNAEISAAMVVVREGSANIDRMFLCTTDSPVIGSSNIVWALRGTDMITAFLGLSDTPATYSGKKYQYPRVNSSETAIEFSKIPVAILQTTRAMTDNTGDVTIAHGLGVAPSYIQVRAMVVFTGTTTGRNSDFSVSSIGYSNGTTNKCSYEAKNNYDSNNQYSFGGQEATKCVYLESTSGASYSAQSASATFDATNITLSWTETNNGFPGTAYIDILAVV